MSVDFVVEMVENASAFCEVWVAVGVELGYSVNVWKVGCSLLLSVRKGAVVLYLED